MGNPIFLAYVDESGDEGFVFHPDGSGSSRWFVLAALVVRRSNDRELVTCLQDVRAVLGKAAKTPLHFRELKHEQRIPYIRRVGELPIRTVSVLMYKPLISETEKFQNTAHLLYRFATGLLLERVSRLCRDTRKKGEGDGFAEVIFSNRSNMSYDAVRDSIRLLLRQAEIGSQRVQIDKTVICPERIRSVEHSRLAGLQAADAIAYSLYTAVTKNRYGETEPGYLAHMKNTLYRRKKAIFGYGLKLWPGELAAIKTMAPEVTRLESL
ncbi:MAG: DUF3800 domain-containing protein [Planctomycetes bacterium]|nr:DUF3800 domain-containing protein [Planctomycetota bacterium]